MATKYYPLSNSVFQASMDKLTAALAQTGSSGGTGRTVEELRPEFCPLTPQFTEEVTGTAQDQAGATGSYLFRLCWEDDRRLRILAGSHATPGASNTGMFVRIPLFTFQAEAGVSYLIPATKPGTCFRAGGVTWGLSLSCCDTGSSYTATPGAGTYAGREGAFHVSVATAGPVTVYLDCITYSKVAEDGTTSMAFQPAQDLVLLDSTDICRSTYSLHIAPEDRVEYRICGHVSDLRLSFAPLSEAPEDFETVVTFLCNVYNMALSYDIASGIFFSGTDCADGVFAPKTQRRYRMSFCRDGFGYRCCVS